MPTVLAPTGYLAEQGTKAANALTMYPSEQHRILQSIPSTRDTPTTHTTTADHIGQARPPMMGAAASLKADRGRLFATGEFEVSNGVSVPALSSKWAPAVQRRRPRDTDREMVFHRFLYKKGGPVIGILEVNVEVFSKINEPRIRGRGRTLHRPRLPPTSSFEKRVGCQSGRERVGFGFPAFDPSATVGKHISVGFDR